MPTFSLKKDMPYRASFSRQPLDIRGIFDASGPQAEEMLPDIIKEIFKKFPDINTVAFSGNKSAVWTRNA